MNGPECAAWVPHERTRGLRLGASPYEVYRGVDEDISAGESEGIIANFLIGL